VGVVCAESDAAARELASSGELSMVRFLQGQRDLPMPSVEEVRAHPWDAEQRAVLAGRGEHVIVGGVDLVRERLSSLVAESGADEVMVLTHVHSHAARRRSYELLAAALQ
jgi:alkanesulfonate monooxygenase SsuD/methylene tetrahydromethanopterin reductase-like flavin-dependent oxidoreductase (luciferase family)